ncbi:MAG: YciI family protein [Acidocella sp.]|nr:YciI family protein [Acidocella sp.]
MKFILIGHDKADGLDIRKATRPAHLAYWQAENGPRLAYGGPLLHADGKPFGSVLVLEADTEAEARALFEADPYVTAGLFEMVSMSGFRTVFLNGVLAE